MIKGSIFAWPYFVMLLTGLMLPSDGNHGLLSPKSLAFIASFFSLTTYFILRRQISHYQLKLLLFTLCAISFLWLWFIFGFIFDSTQMAGAVDQFKLFIITLSVSIMTLYLISEKLASPQKIIRIVIYANFTYSLIKLTLVALHLLNIINMWSVLEAMGIRFMSMLILHGIARLQTSVDIITPFLLFFVLQSTPLKLVLSKNFQRIFSVISILSIFLSFSRFLIMVGAVSYLLYWMTLSASRISKGLFSLIVVCFIATYLIGTENVAQIFEQRFLSSDNTSSDQTRVDQIHALLNEFYQTPYLGMGMGGKARDVVRDHELQHSYEVQWVAFLMQFGVIGILFLCVPLAMISQFFVSSTFSRVKSSFFVLFLLWLFSGFTNPFLISLTSGIVYSIFLAAGDILSSHDEREEILFQNFPVPSIPHKNLPAIGKNSAVEEK
jgi:hypothetical protein